MLTMKTEVEDNVTEHTIEMGHSIAYVGVVENEGIHIQVYNCEEDKVLDTTLTPVNDKMAMKAIRIACDFLASCEG